MSAFDLAVTFPAPGSIVVRSAMLFGDPDGPLCQRFVERVFQVPQICELAITSRGSAHVELRYCPRAAALREIVNQVAYALGHGTGDAPEGQAPCNVPPAHAARDGRGVVRYFRFEAQITGWRVRSTQPGRVRLHNPTLRRNASRCRPMEHALCRQPGVTRARANAWLGTLDVAHDPTQCPISELIRLLDVELANSAPVKMHPDADLHAGVCTAIVPVAAAAQLAVPPLVPLAAAACAYAALPTLRRAYRAVAAERRLGTDALEAVVILGCLGTLSLFPAALICWCRGLGQMVAERTHDRSRRLILNGFSPPSQRVWLHRDGVDVRVDLERIQAGDIVAVEAGEVIPVDGPIVDGSAWVDQEPLTGETAPVERGVGQTVFASTTLLAGRVYVSVERCGDSTAAAAIGRVLHDTAVRSLSEQPRAERMTDRAALPALVLGGVGAATLGPISGLAILKSNAGAGIKSAGSYATLGAVALCAQRGIVVREARGLEQMSAVDTVVLDGNAIVDGNLLTVEQVATLPGFTAEQVLRWAAAAGQRFHEPVQRAIVGHARATVGALPRADEVQCRIGQGIRARVEGHAVRTGDPQFVGNGGAGLPVDWIETLGTNRQDGRAIVLVSVDDRLAGAIVLEAAVRPELQGVVAGLRERGVVRIRVATDDAALRGRLAVALGPECEHVQGMPRSDFQRQVGEVVCFVGDGNERAVTANVHVAFGTDPSAAADFVVLEGSLSRLCDLRDVARDLQTNVDRAWALALAPNAVCIAGVFTLGLGMMASVIASNVAALAALTHSVLPLRRAARAEAERRHRQELRQRVAVERDSL